MRIHQSGQITQLENSNRGAPIAVGVSQFRRLARASLDDLPCHTDLQSGCAARGTSSAQCTRKAKASPPCDGCLFNLDQRVSYPKLQAMHLLAREETGLRCLLQVALGELAGEPVPIARIAAAESISSVYAAKLMRQLRLASLVESRRGAAGGYHLTRPAKEITVWDAIQALDESFLPGNDCACQPEDRVDCRRTTTCAIASLWRRLGYEIRSSLEAVTLAELCDGALEKPDRVDLRMMDAPA